jgi:hypothetical protein
MSEAIVDLVKNTLIPELQVMGGIVTRINAVVGTFMDIARQHPDTSFSQVTGMSGGSVDYRHMKEVAIKYLDNYSSEAIAKLDAAYIEIAVEGSDIDKETLLSKYATRLSILLGVFRLRFYDNLTAIASLQHDNEDMQALSDLSKIIISDFSTPINNGLPDVGAFLKLLAEDDGVVEESDRAYYSEWVRFGIDVMQGVYMQILPFFTPLTDYAQKQIYLNDKGFSAEDFNRKLEEDEKAFEAEAVKELSLEEFGLVDEPNSSLVESEARIKAREEGV